MPDQNSKAAIAEERPVFTWKANEFAEYQKNAGWFILLILIAAGLTAYFVWSKSWTSAGVVVAGAFALLSTARLVPKQITCSLYRDGAVIDGKAVRYSDLKSFWIIAGAHPVVRLARPGRFASAINMPIAEEDPEQIRLFLSKFLPEESDRGEDIADTITRWTKF